MHALSRPEVMIGNAAQQFDAQGNLTDTTTQDLIRQVAPQPRRLDAPPPGARRADVRRTRLCARTQHKPRTSIREPPCPLVAPISIPRPDVVTVLVPWALRPLLQVAPALGLPIVGNLVVSAIIVGFQQGQHRDVWCARVVGPVHGKLVAGTRRTW